MGLNISTSPTVDVIIEVDTVPAMWQGTEVQQRGRDGVTRTRVQYNTLHTVDLTDGQLSKVPYHKVFDQKTIIAELKCVVFLDKIIYYWCFSHQQI